MKVTLDGGNQYERLPYSSPTLFGLQSSTNRSAITAAQVSDHERTDCPESELPMAEERESSAMRRRGRSRFVQTRKGCARFGSR